MRYLSITLTLLFLSLTASTAEAQIFERIKLKVEEKIEEIAEDIKSEVEKILDVENDEKDDEAEDAEESKETKPDGSILGDDNEVEVKKEEEKTYEYLGDEEEEVADLPKEEKTSSTDTSTDTSTSSNTNTGNTTKKEEVEEKLPGYNEYKNYRFLPGEMTLFYDDLSQDGVADDPSRWNVKEGSASVMGVQGRKAITSVSYNKTEISPAISSPIYLSNAFTIEFDVFVDDIKRNGSAEVNYELFLSNDQVKPIVLNMQFGELSGKVLTDEFPLEAVDLGKRKAWHRIALSFYKGKLKMYYDEKRIADFADVDIDPDQFRISMEANAFQTKKLLYAISHVKIAYGGIDIQKKFESKGTYTTSTILFDEGTANIKAYSRGVITRMVSLMKKNEEWNFMIVGHTDNTSSTADQIALSKERAETIKEMLIAQGIDASRLSTSGKGNAARLSSKNTTEAKVNNRRVEFVKQ